MDSRCLFLSRFSQTYPDNLGCEAEGNVNSKTRGKELHEALSSRGVSSPFLPRIASAEQEQIEWGERKKNGEWGRERKALERREGEKEREGERRLQCSFCKQLQLEKWRMMMCWRRFVLIAFALLSHKYPPPTVPTTQSLVYFFINSLFILLQLIKYNL